jgi:proteasome accessory factor C
MRRRTTAGDQLTRILHLLPRAARRQGVTVLQLARELGVAPEELMDDLETISSRADYHVAGSGEDTQIVVDAERVFVWTTGEFRRPIRFSPAEALALGLGLRILAAEREEPGSAGVLALAERLERTLTAIDPGSPEEAIVVGAGAGSRTTRVDMLEAARAGRCCEIRYLKPAAVDAEQRRIAPYVLVAAEGFWYVLARCSRAESVRAFRLDRIIDVEVLDETFEIPADFDPHAFLRGGRVFSAAEETEVLVRYSPLIARWMVEKGPTEPQPDGSVLVRHRVADPHWLVRHVLQYGRDAEVVKPREFREMVAASVGRILAPRQPA